MTSGRPGGWYVVRRLLQAVPMLLSVLVIAFVLIHLAPGEPLYLIAGDGGDAAYYAEMRALYGLDQPLLVQLERYVLTAIRGDFGYSFRYQQPVFQVVLSHVPATLLLTGTALLLSLALGIVLGVVSAARPGGLLDRGITVLTSLLHALPVFWVGQLLLLALAIGLKLFPIQGMVTVRERYTGLRHVADVLYHLALPALTLTLAQLTIITRIARTSLREVLGEDFIRTAHAKGLPQRQIVWRHALRNALLPLTTVVGGQVSGLLTGAALTETIFAWPGLGQLLLDAARNRDYPLLMAIMIVVALLVVIANLLTDLAYARLDPRVRYG